MKKIKWGIIGPGIIAHSFAQDFAHVTKGELVAVASRNEERAKKFADQYKIPKVYTSYESLCEDPEIDAIYIATPHNFHYDQTLLALQSNKAVLCEKPLTHIAEQTDELIAFAEQSGNYLMEGMWTYFLPVIQKAKQWVKEGKIGKVKHVKSEFGYPVPYDTSSRYYDPKLAGGALLDMGVYNVAMACFFFDGKEPSDIHVVARKAESGVDHDVTTLLVYEDEIANLTTAFRCKLPNSCIIIGEEGYIEIPDFWRAKECRRYKMEDCVEVFEDHRNGNGFEFEIEAVSIDLLEGRKSSEVVPWEVSKHLQSVMKKIMEKFD
ncbi:Gfo/Idh/MocA family protein [Sediminitomix flava]|uniref:Putative dehydrogenase n=1 Tax=Sediminitomix flava TaxID=379075 RepID=A0A315Z8K2_SEDFL|nr:Gfo/Idh/MocA family oxidoreductase [Sediminitomix flava]PWJ41895.1 putative dehydrogenase [Sediminitomix flava]